MTDPRPLGAAAETLAKQPDDVRAALQTLGARVALEMRAAQRAGIGSNGRRRHVARARFLRWAAGQILSDPKLQARLRDRGMLDVGWRALAEELAVVARKLEGAGEKASAR